MKTLISENFKRRLDSLHDRQKSERIVAKLAEFSRELHKVERQFRNLPAGFWVRKLEGSPNIFKFRVNNGDRILFTPFSACGGSRTGFDGSIIYIDYCTHDEQVRKGRRSSGDYSPTDLEIDVDQSFDNNDVDDRRILESPLAQYGQHLSYDLNQSVTYVLDDDKLVLLLEENNQDWLFYLNDNQYQCLRHLHTPLRLRGSAGSGKTTVALHKLLACSNSEYDVAYFTYTKHLLDNAKRLYDRYKNPDDKARFFKISDYCLEIAGFKEFDQVTFERFLNWYEETRFRFKFFENFDPMDVWSEIRGVIKGFMGLKWDRDVSLPLLELRNYLKLSDKYSVFSPEERKLLFEIAFKYQEWLKSEGKVDENDCTRLAIENLQRSGRGKLDFIVVDEVQDLTELQIFFLLQHVHDVRNIFFSGDEHQTVNPTYFGFHRIGVFFSERSTITSELISLHQNYRSQRNVVELANNLIDLRRQYIGATNCDYHESFVRDGRKPFLITNNSQMLEELVAKANERHYCIIVTADFEEKRKITKRLGDNSRVFTVSEVKGLEYSYVICCNLISHSRQYWDDIFENRGKKDARYRYFFNSFYVAITRARENLCIYEDDDDLPLFDRIGSHFDVVEDFSEERLRLTQFSSSADWLKEAKSLEAHDKLTQAIGAYQKAEDGIGVARCQARLLAREGKYKDAGEVAWSAGLFEEASEYYRQAGDVFNNLKSRIWSGESFSELRDLDMNLSHQVNLFIKEYPPGEDLEPFLRYFDAVMKTKIDEKAVQVNEFIELMK